MSEKKQQILLKMLLVFIVLQPILDILSRGAILGIIPNISKYIKSIFVFGITGYLLLFYSPKKTKWLIYAILFMILTGAHTYMLYQLLVSNDVILHEFRYLVNVAYMIAMYISFDTIYYYSRDKEEMYRQIKRAILYSFILYFALYLLAIVTKTSGMTYEVSDKNKLGFKGWYHSGQILGHAYSIMMPLIMYVTLDPKKKWYKRGLVLLLFIISVSLLGTKVPYYMTLIVLILYLIITLSIKLFNKEHRPNLFNIVFSIIMIIGMISTYKYTPVKYNTDINHKVASTAISSYDLVSEACYEIADPILLKKMYPDRDISKLLEYNTLSNQASDYLVTLFESGKLHPGDTRLKQIRYAIHKYNGANIWYKLFGLGFLNQNTSLAIETDFNMAIFSFGIIGFILFFTLPIKELIVTTIYILKNLKTADFETYMLYLGLGIFFSISIFVGCTYVYPQCSIFIVLLVILLRTKRDSLKKAYIKDNKISFLMLHLGYGGIETAVINSANMLNQEYNVELISLYNLDKNQVNRIDENIAIKYLYNGGPNKEAFLDSVRKKQIFRIIKEGIKAVYILFLKKVLIIREIRNSNSKFLVSTRMEFSTLLSKYGNDCNIKIAEEHRYHNNEVEYINTIKYKYGNIDYLFALTKTLYDDYREFLKGNNDHTKVELVPNLLYDIPNETSKLDKKEIITMSRLDAGKCIDDIIKAMALIDNHEWHLNILGDGSEYNNLKNLISELKLEDRVSLVGYKTKEEMKPYLLNASMFLMASVTEGLPMVLLEAMSYGLPCVAFKTASGVNDIITDGYNGYIVNDRNMDLYVKRINALINDNKKRKEMGVKAKSSVVRFSKEEIIKKWDKVLKN